MDLESTVRKQSDTIKELLKHNKELTVKIEQIESANRELSVTNSILTNRINILKSRIVELIVQSVSSENNGGKHRCQKF